MYLIITKDGKAWHFKKTRSDNLRDLRSLYDYDHYTDNDYFKPRQ